MNTTLLSIIVIVLGGVAALQINSLYNRVSRLEVDLDHLMTALEKAVKIANQSKED